MVTHSIIEPIKHDPMLSEHCLVDFDTIVCRSEVDLMIGMVLDGFYELTGGRKWATWGKCC
jgi:hypothetical protein